MIKWQEKLGSIHWNFFFLIASEKYPPFTDLGVVLFKWDDVGSGGDTGLHKSVGGTNFRHGSTQVTHDLIQLHLLPLLPLGWHFSQKMSSKMPARNY